MILRVVLSLADQTSSSSIRKQRRREHPTTPNKYRKCSRRCFDGQLRTWRRNLHQFDDITKQEPTETNELNENDIEYDKSSSSSSSKPSFHLVHLLIEPVNS